MKLIPKEIESTLPALYSQENVLDPVAVIKIFDPLGRCTFYVLEGSRQPDGDLLLFGNQRQVKPTNDSGAPAAVRCSASLGASDIDAQTTFVSKLREPAVPHRRSPARLRA